MCSGPGVIVKYSVIDVLLKVCTLRVEPIVDVMFGRNLHIDLVRFPIVLTIKAAEIGRQYLIAMVYSRVVRRALSSICEVIEHVEVRSLYRIDTAGGYTSVYH